MISSISNNDLLAQMETLKVEVRNGTPNTDSTKNSFGTLFVSALNSANTDQLQSAELTRRFVSGENGVSAADVMAVNHKAEISSEITKQVRNKALEHFKEIINTQL